MVTRREGAEVAIGEAIETGLPIVRHWVVSDLSWATHLYATQQTRGRYSNLHAAPRSSYQDAQKNLKPKVTMALTENCKKKLNDLLGKLKSGVPDISALASNAIDGVGISLSVTDESIDYLYDKGFSLGAKTVRRLAPAGATENRNSIVFNRKILGQNYEVLTFIHELLHTTRKGDDHEDVAREIAAMEGVGTQFKSYLKGRSHGDREASGFINSWLNANCDIKAEGVQSWQEVLKAIGVN